MNDCTPCPYCDEPIQGLHRDWCPRVPPSISRMPEPPEAGVKYDAGKTRPSLVLDGFANALEEVSKVATFGARKYTDDGWVNVPDGEKRYKDALYRHLLAEAKGQPADQESECLHLAHAAWNILAVLELKLRG